MIFAKKLGFILLVIVSLLPLMCVPAFAEENNPDDANIAGVGEGYSNGDNFQNILTIIVVLVIIVALIYFLIKFLAHKNQSWMSNRSTRLLGGVVLGQNRSLQIVEIGEKIYIVGVGEDIRLIDKIEDPEEVAGLLESIASTGKSISPILPQFNKFLNKWKKQPGESKHDEIQNVEVSFQEMLHGKLRQVSNRKQMMDRWMKDEMKEDRSNEE